jgi:prolyl oligopeptidase
MPALQRTVIAALLSLAAARALAAEPQMVRPPYTRTEVVRDTLHGEVIEDPYRWLERGDSPETQAWERQQMAYTQHLLTQVGERDSIRRIVARLTKVDTRSLPLQRGSRLFFSERGADQELAVLRMQERGGAAVTLVDPAGLDSTLGTTVGYEDVSPDGALVAFHVRKGGEDEVEVRFLDAATRRDRPDRLPRARYLGVTLSHDGKGVYYCRYGASGSRVGYHAFGTDAAKDANLFGDALAPGELPIVSQSDDGHWLIIQVRVGSAGDDMRLYLKDLRRPGKLTVVAEKLHAWLSPLVVGEDLYLLTNWNAPNRRVMVAKLADPRPDAWRELVPERKDVVLQSLSVVGGRLYLTGIQNVVAHLYTYGLAGEAFGEIALPGLGTVSDLRGRSGDRDGYYLFSALDQAPAIFRLDTSTDTSSVWWRSAVPFDASRYEVRQFNVRSSGGAKVLFFVVSRKGLAFDGENPTLLTGYGGFNQARTSQFSTMAAAWLELGGVYVLANLRGGSEFGEAWHRDGMLANKQHTFDDFIAVAQWLIGRGICRPAKLAIMGGSNGGLLVGAAMTQRPDLFGAVVCSVPLLDMLRYHRFLVARLWVPEYGSAENAEQFQWLKAYSPYHHVQRGVKYPATLFLSGDSDTRVDPLHARKMTALMQSLGGEAPMLLRYDSASGHSGGKSAERGIDDTVDVLQFLRWRLGMLPAAP